LFYFTISVQQLFVLGEEELEQYCCSWWFLLLVVCVSMDIYALLE
jgi:hypothetical protein